MSPKKSCHIVLIGAGSASFGLGTVADVLGHEALARHDVTLRLVDIDEAALAKTLRLAEMIRAYRGSRVRIEATTDRTQALPGADFVVTSVTRQRMALWEQDFRVPLAFGFRHCLGENGGPGALFHAMRNYEVILPICRDVERLCPDALVLNFTNPESRILMAMCHLTRVRAVGLCHGVLGARKDVARWLGRDLADLDIVTGGMNHLFWILRVAERAGGRDLYDDLRREVQRHAPPLVRKMTEVFDLLVFPSDDHVGEYLSFATEFTGTLWPYGREHQAAGQPPAADWREPYLSGARAADEDLAKPSGEIAVDLLTDLLDDTGRWQPTVNVLNTDGYVENLPTDAVVEVPAKVDARGIHPEKVGPLPEALAALCRTQVSIQKILLDAYRTRSRKLLLQALLLDPCVHHVGRAEAMLDHMLELQKAYLPHFE